MPFNVIPNNFFENLLIPFKIIQSTYMRLVYMRSKSKEAVLNFTCHEFNYIKIKTLLYHWQKFYDMFYSTKSISSACIILYKKYCKRTTFGGVFFLAPLAVDIPTPNQVHR